MGYTLVLINRIMNPYVVLFYIKFGEPKGDKWLVRDVRLSLYKHYSGKFAAICDLAVKAYSK